MNNKLTEFKIDTDGVDIKYVDWLILGLVRCGHETYTSDNYVCFTGWSDEVISI